MNLDAVLAYLQEAKQRHGGDIEVVAEEGDYEGDGDFLALNSIPGFSEEGAEYEVSLTNAFRASTYEEAVKCMIEHILGTDVCDMNFRVNLAGHAHVEYVDGIEV